MSNIKTLKKVFADIVNAAKKDKRIMMDIRVVRNVDYPKIDSRHQKDEYVIEIYWFDNREEKS